MFLMVFLFRREKGIRTLDMLPYTRFPSVRLQPLGHLSIYFEVANNTKKNDYRKLLINFYEISPRKEVSKTFLKIVGAIF